MLTLAAFLIAAPLLGGAAYWLDRALKERRTIARRLRPLPSYPPRKSVFR